MKAVFVLVLVFVGCHGFGIEPESTHQNENRGFLGGIFETGIFETVGEAVGGISEAVGQTLGIVSCKSGSVGQTCSIGCKCSGDNTCEAGSQKCRAPGTAGDSCHLTRPCGSGLTCEAGSQKCRKAGEWRDSCHLTRPCGPGLSCQPGVHKCYNSPRKFGEPCVAGYGCGYGLKCHHTVHKCTVEGIAACDKAMGALGVSIGAPLAVGATCFFSAGTLCAGAAKIGAKVVSKSAKIMVKSFVECKEEADKIHPGIDIPYSTPDCSWSTPTHLWDYLECMDGTTCSGAVSWSCCNSRGGRAKCPLSNPHMCAKDNDCADGTDFCCENDNECSTKDHGGNRPCPGGSDSATFHIKKYGHECNSKDQSLGKFDTVEECSEACTSTAGCRFFVFGTKGKEGKCYWEKTETGECLEGWQSDAYDFFENSKHP